MDKYTHSVWIGVTLTATSVHLDTAVPNASRAVTLQYIATVLQLMLSFVALDPPYIFDSGSQFNIAPGDQNKVRCRDKYTLALSRATIDDQLVGDVHGVKAETSIPLHCLVLPHIGFEGRDKYTLPLSHAAINDHPVGDACQVKAKTSIPVSCYRPLDSRAEVMLPIRLHGCYTIPEVEKIQASTRTVLTMIQEPSHTLFAYCCWLRRS